SRGILAGTAGCPQSQVPSPTPPEFSIKVTEMKNKESKMGSRQFVFLVGTMVARDQISELRKRAVSTYPCLVRAAHVALVQNVPDQSHSIHQIGKDTVPERLYFSRGEGNAIDQPYLLLVPNQPTANEHSSAAAPERQNHIQGDTSMSSPEEE
ncbi:14532_t:CDS:1, partial [Acaulospora colombiana]